MRNRRLSASPAARSAPAPTATIEGCRYEKTDCAAGSAGLQPILTRLCRWAQETPSSETPESPRTRAPHRPVRNVSRRLGRKASVAPNTSLRRGVLFRAAVQRGTNSINPLPLLCDFQIVPSAVFKKSPPRTGAPHNEEICSLARNCCGRDGTCHSGIRQDAQAPQTSSSCALDRRINSLNPSAKHKAPPAGLCVVSVCFVGSSNCAFSQCLTKLPYHCR